MKEVRRCLAWVRGHAGYVRQMEDGTYWSAHFGEPIAAEEVTEIPSAEWLRANESDFRKLLEACHTLSRGTPDTSKAFDAWAIIRDIVDRRWRAQP